VDVKEDFGFQDLKNAMALPSSTLAAHGKDCIFLKATRLVADAKVVLWTPRH
jgi:hypothetical protein